MAPGGGDNPGKLRVRVSHEEYSGQTRLTPGQIAPYFAPGDTNVFIGPRTVDIKLCAGAKGAHSETIKGQTQHEHGANSAGHSAAEERHLSQNKDFLRKLAVADNALGHPVPALCRGFGNNGTENPFNKLSNLKLLVENTLHDCAHVRKSLSFGD
jgi:hypothetical protein